MRPVQVPKHVLDRHAILSDERLKGGGREKILSGQARMQWDYPESAQDIVAKSRRDMLRDAAYELQECLSRLHTTVKKIDSAARSYLSIAYEHLLQLEKEEKRKEEPDGKTRQG